MRVQRTRSSSSVLRLPLMLHPLGGEERVSASWGSLRGLRLFQAPAAMKVLRVAIVGSACVTVQAAQHRLARLLRRRPLSHRDRLPTPSGVARVAEGAVGLRRVILWRWRCDEACPRQQKQGHQDKQQSSEPQDSPHAVLRFVNRVARVSIGQSNMRIQRTRSSPSALRSQLSHPLGRAKCQEVDE